MRRFFGLLAIFALTLPAAGRSETYTIPFADLQAIIDASGDSPDAAIRGYLATLIRDELDALGLDVNAGLVIDDIPIEEYTETIRTDCDFPVPTRSIRMQRPPR